MAITNTVTCPRCSEINDANDLFCKNCGESLANVALTIGQTATLTPVPQQDMTQTTAVAPAVAPQPVQPMQQYSYPVTETPVSTGSMPPVESARGAVLGWLAALLFLLIVGFFVWSSLLSDATRDRFTGWF